MTNHRLIASVKGIGIEIAAQHNGNPRKYTLGLLQYSFHLLQAARAARPVFQMDGYRADLLSLHIKLCKNRIAAADALLSVMIPVILLRQTEHLCPQDRPARKDCIAVKPVCSVLQLDKLQPEHILHSQRTGDLCGSIPLARPGTAAIQFIGQDQVIRPQRRAFPEKIHRFGKAYAPLHVEHQRIQFFLLRRRTHKPGHDLRLKKLRNIPHHRILRFLLQPCRRLQHAFFCQFFHTAPLYRRRGIGFLYSLKYSVHDTALPTRIGIKVYRKVTYSIIFRAAGSSWNAATTHMIVITGRLAKL